MLRPMNRLTTCLLVLVPCLSKASAELREFFVIADAGCAATSSTASGTGTFLLDTQTHQVSFSISLSGLLVDHMHVHGPADDCTLAFFAPTQVWLPGLAESSGTFELTPEQQADMLAEKYYINVHTERFGGGEIRGQVLLTCPNDCSGHGLCEEGVCRCDSGWGGSSCQSEFVVPAVSAISTMLGAGVMLSIGVVVLKKRTA